MLRTTRLLFLLLMSKPLYLSEKTQIFEPATALESKCIIGIRNIAIPNE